MPLSSVRWFGQLIHWRADCTLWTAPFAIFCRHDSCDILAPPPGITNFQQGRSFSSKPKLLDQKPPYLCPRMSTAPQRQPLCQNSHRATTGDHVTIKMAAARQRHCFTIRTALQRETTLRSKNCGRITRAHSIMMSSSRKENIFSNFLNRRSTLRLQVFLQLRATFW